ncbi:MAG: hypothetical protein WBH77_08365 [Saccharofermentanales bacterium]
MRNDYSKADIDYIINAVRYVLEVYADSGKKWNEVGKAVGIDSSTVGKYYRGTMDIKNMRAKHYMKVFEFYINNFQNNENT